MFLQKTRRKQPCNYARTQRIAILLSAILLLTAVPWLAFGTKAYAANATGTKKRGKKRVVELVQPFDKTYELEVKGAGKMIADINAKGVGRDLHVSFDLIPFAYIMEYWQPKQTGHTMNTTLKANANGDVSGEVKSDHILYEGTYHLRVWADDGIRLGTNVDVNLHCQNVKIEDASFHADNAIVAGSDISITDKKTHHYMLSGYSDQNDYEDGHGFHVDHAGYVTIKAKTDSNPGNVPYSVTLSRDTDHKKIKVYHPGKKACKDRIKVKPGDYSLSVQVEDKRKLTDRQILYSLYVARYIMVKSVRCDHKSLQLFDLRGYRRANLKATINGSKPAGKWVRFKSAKPSVVSVSQKGVLQAKQPGETVITCYSVENPKVAATCRVMVAKPFLKISADAGSVYEGKNLRLSVSKMPRKQKITWKTTNPTVARVSSSGVVTGMKAGTAKIYAVSRAGIRSGSCTVIVKKKQQTKPDPDPSDPSDPSKPSPQHLSLTVSSAHLSPRGTVTVRANVAGGTFSTHGGIAIKSRSSKTCVIRATASSGEGTVTYCLNGKRVTRHIVIY